MKRTTIVVFASALVLAGSANAAPPAVNASPAALNDGKIEKVVKESNDADIEAAKLAKKKSENPLVKDFANMMIQDHQAADKKTDQVAKKINVKPENNDVAEKMEREQDAKINNLKKLSGAEFDHAYIQHEIAFHQKVLDDIDHELMPNAKSPEVKSLLEGIRPVVAEHLSHAKQVDYSLRQGKVTSTG